MHKRPHIRGRERRFSHVRQWRRRRHRHLHQCSWHLCSRTRGRLPLAAGSLENDRLQRQTEQIQEKNTAAYWQLRNRCLKNKGSSVEPFRVNLMKTGSYFTPKTHRKKIVVISRRLPLESLFVCNSTLIKFYPVSVNEMLLSSKVVGLMPDDAKYDEMHSSTSTSARCADNLPANVIN